MAEALDDSSTEPLGLSVEVLAAGTAFAASASVTGLAALSVQQPPSALLLLGWPFLAAAGGVVLDQQPGSRVGRTLAVLSLGSVLLVAWTLLRFDGLAPAAALAHGGEELAALLAGGVAVAVPWSVRAPRATGTAAGLTGLAALGALAVLAARAGPAPDRVAPVGWVLVVVGTAGAWAAVASTARSEDRMARRRVGSTLATLAVAGVVVAAAWVLGNGVVGYYATAAALILTAITVAALQLGTDFRPLDEHLLDLGLVLGTLLTAALTATLVQVGSRLAGHHSSRTGTVFTVLLTAAMVAPVALWLRRAALARRYGTGVLVPEDVARITADMHAQTEPRDLLDKAARMVAAASGSKDARIVLGDDADDEPVLTGRWLVHPLVVGGDRVGALLIEASSAEGPEARQQKVVAQLLPTVALVARAVGLAVEAEHARRDVSREREAERRRVLGDLHDGLGPLLAGMSMRVQASLRTPATPDPALLRELAEGLATSRADLRRIVAGITPSTLDDGDLDHALHLLVRSFQGATDLPEVRLVVEVDDEVGADLQVAVYRSVAEGITNALRHAAAGVVEVSVRSGGGRLLVDVADDGGGGPVVPGVGLSSLARRAEGLGGTMRVCPGRGSGTVLHLDLPLRGVRS